MTINQTQAGAVLCVGATPAAQRVMVFRKLVADAVNRAITTVDGIAGKSVNVAKVLKVLGAEPVAVGFVGGERGEALRLVLRERGVQEEFVRVTPPTRQCITVIDESVNSHTELVEESQPVLPRDYARLLEVVRRRIKGCRAMVLSGTITPGGPIDFYLQCVEAARCAGALSVVDGQGPVLVEALKGKPDLVKPNRAELAVSIGAELKDEAAVRAAMQELCRRGAGQVVVTAGGEPAVAFDGKSFWRVHAPWVEAFNPIGSGDAFTAGLVWRLLRGEELREACRWASAAGAANALTLMAGEVQLAEVRRLAKRVEIERAGP